jgi:hypothetical protein
MRKTVLTCALIIGVLFLACTKQAEVKDVPFQTLAKGIWGGPGDPSDRVILDAAAVEEIWAQFKPDVGKPAPLPGVDFENEMILATFAGQKPTGGYFTEIKAVRDSGKEIQVHVTETEPPSDVSVITVLTHPYHIVKIPRTDKPVTFVHSEAVGKTEGTEKTE